MRLETESVGGGGGGEEGGRVRGGGHFTRETGWRAAHLVLGGVVDDLVGPQLADELRDDGVVKRRAQVSGPSVDE